MRRYIFSVIVLTLLFTGCATGPDYIKPKAQEPEKWIKESDPAINTESTDLSKWWTVFNDPALDSLIIKACNQNLPLRIAGIRILEARAQLGIAFGNIFPQQQQIAGGYTYTNLSENGANTLLGDIDYGDVSVGFDAAWELDFWGKFRRAIESGVGSMEASVANYDDMLVTLTAEVARTYTLIRTFEVRLAIAEENVKVQKESLHIVEVRFKAEDVTELDVQQAKTLLNNTQSLIPRLSKSLRQAKNGLAILLGILPGEIDNIIGQSKIIPTAPAQVAVGIPAELLRRRPDIRLAERQLASQSAKIGVAKADLFPHFALFGSVGLKATDGSSTRAGGAGGSSFGDLFESDSFEIFAGPSITWDIFNYGRIKNRVRVEDARFQQLIVNYRNAVLLAARETEDAMIDFTKTQEEVRYLHDSVTASKRSVFLSQIQYREGLTSYQRVLDSLRSLANAEDNLTERRGAVATSLIAMYKALGGGWQIRVGKEFIPEETKKEMRSRTNWGGLLDPEELETSISE